MKYVWILLFFSVSSFAQEKPVFYYLNITTSNAEVKCFINGFPVYTHSGTSEMSNQIPVNLSLIGKNNVLKIVATTLGADAKVSGGIAPYDGGDVVSTDDKKSGVLTFDFAVEKEISRNFNFDNERFDFSYSIASTSVINDEKALIDYGMKIIELISQGDANALIVEMKPKIEDNATSYSVEPALVANSLKEVFEGGMFKGMDKVLKTEIKPVSYCDGKVWELTNTNGHPLIYVQEEDGSLSLPIYVAKINGELRVIR